MCDNFLKCRRDERAPMEDINLMREYIRLVECRNFTLVAKEFFVSQPTVTKHVQRLEREFGAKLMERTTHAVEVTDAGLAAYEGCRRIIEEYDKMTGSIARVRRGDARQLRLGVLYHGIAELALPLVALLAERHPDIEVTFVSCQSNEGYDRLREGTLDAAIVHEFDRLDGLDYVPTSSPERYCVVTSDNELMGGDCVSLDELERLDLVYLSRDFSLSMIESLGVPYHRCVPVENIDALPMELARSGGYTVLDAHLKGKLGPSLAFIPFETPIQHESYGVACRSDDDRPMVWDLMDAASELGL